MNYLERFLAVMAFEPVDQVPNWEAGVWPQTRDRWEREGLDPNTLHWDWFSGEEALDMDPREFIPFRGRMYPLFEEEIREEDERTVTFRDTVGRVRRALKDGSIGGARMSMDTYLRFPVENADDWAPLKRRFDPRRQQRYEPNWKGLRVDGWHRRSHPLILGPNCSTLGFYWFARDLMGTENLSYAFFDQPALVHDIMETQTELLIESARPYLERTTIDYMCLNEDLSAKSGPLLSPRTYKEFVYPRLRRVVDFYKANGVTYVCIDTDGNPEPLIPMMLDAGVDALWPLERASDQDPIRLRKEYGHSLRLWGGVDKRELIKGRREIDEHLLSLAPLIEGGGFIPTVDHTVPPDVSWENFQYYMERKTALLRGEL